MIDHLCLLMVLWQSVSIWGTPKHGSLPAFHSQFYFVDVWLCSYLRWQEACSSWHECSGGHSNQQSLEPPHNSVFSSTLDKWQSSEITTCPLTAQGGVCPCFQQKPAVAKNSFIATGTRVVGSDHVQCTMLCEQGSLLFRTLFHHVILYKQMSTNLWPGIHCKSCVRGGIEEEKKKKEKMGTEMLRIIQLKPAIAPSDCIWLVCKVSQWKSVTSLALPWVLECCWYQTQVFILIFSGVFSGSLFPAVNIQLSFLCNSLLFPCHCVFKWFVL